MEKGRPTDIYHKLLNNHHNCKTDIGTIPQLVAQKNWQDTKNFHVNHKSDFS